MPGSLVDDAEHWRDRAAEARLAEEMKDEASREAMLRIAEDYEKLAVRALQRVKVSLAAVSPSDP